MEKKMKLKKIVEFSKYFFSAKSLALVKPFHTTLSNPLWKAAPVLGWVYPLISRCLKGKRHHHGSDVCWMVNAVVNHPNTLFFCWISYGRVT